MHKIYVDHGKSQDGVLEGVYDKDKKGFVVPGIEPLIKPTAEFYFKDIDSNPIFKKPGGYILDEKYSKKQLVFVLSKEIGEKIIFEVQVAGLWIQIPDTTIKAQKYSSWPALTQFEMPSQGENVRFEITNTGYDEGGKKSYLFVFDTKEEMLASEDKIEKFLEHVNDDQS